MRAYQAHETARMAELNGLVLAEFWQRAGAFLFDFILVTVLLLIVLLAGGFVRWMAETGGDVSQHRSYHVDLSHGEAGEAIELLLPLLYFGSFTYAWNGQTPGKRLFKIRIVSLVHGNMSLWHSLERALGYGAAALEFGFGFFQFFLHPNRRTAQDRLAETIVVTEQAYRERFRRPAVREHVETVSNSK